MTNIRTIFLTALAALFISISPPASAQTSAVGAWTGSVQWNDATGATVTWTLHPNGTMSTNTVVPEFGYWVQVRDYVEMIYPCTNGEYICHYRGRIYRNTLSGAATTNEGHTANFEMRR